MTDSILDLTQFTETIGTRSFLMWRRSTSNMLAARGVVGCFGQAAGSAVGKTSDITPEEQLDYQLAILRGAMIAPAMAAEGEDGHHPEVYTAQELAPLVDRLFLKYMSSGVDATTFIKRSKAQKD